MQALPGLQHQTRLLVLLLKYTQRTFVVRRGRQPWLPDDLLNRTQGSLTTLRFSRAPVLNNEQPGLVQMLRDTAIHHRVLFSEYRQELFHRLELNTDDVPI